MCGFKCKFQFMKRKETLTGKSSSDEAYSNGKEVSYVNLCTHSKAFLFIFISKRRKMEKNSEI